MTHHSWSPQAHPMLFSVLLTIKHPCLYLIFYIKRKCNVQIVLSYITKPVINVYILKMSFSITQLRKKITKIIENIYVHSLVFIFFNNNFDRLRASLISLIAEKTFSTYFRLT